MIVFYIAMLFAIKLIITLTLHKVYSSNELNLTMEEINKLDNILTSKLSNITIINENALDSFLSNSIENSTDNLDLSAFDTETQKKVLSVAETKNKMAEEFLNNTRRDERRYGELTAAHDVKYFKTKALDLMKQSVYSTKYRLQDTREIRKIFSTDVAYKMAILYGSLMQLRLKLDNTYATLKKISNNYKFIFFLTLYERCVVIHVDVMQMVERIFQMSYDLRKLIGGETDTDELLEIKERKNA